jgi:hypothetical protein
MTPGQVYVFEVIASAQDTWGVIWEQTPAAYPHGAAIVLGAASNADLWFRTGLRGSTPLSEAYCKNGLWQHVSHPDGSAWQSENDCLQYVNAQR